MENDLHKLFVDQLRDIYDAEHRITEALPKKIEAAESSELKQGLQNHLNETKEQIVRLEKVFDIIGESAKRNTCEAIKGLIKEAQELLSDFKKTDAVDAAIICAAQKIEHYEMATYGCLCTWAKLMGHNDALSLLTETLNEEKQADATLTDAAKQQANQAASR